MTDNRRRGPRRGYTLLEMVITLPLMTLLIVGSTGAIGIVARVAESSGSGADTIMRAPAALELMGAEIECANAVADRTATTLSITVGDRTGDGVNDSIGYAWNGTPGLPLTRQLNGGTPEPLLANVQAFSITSNTTTSGSSTVLQSIDVRLVVSGVDTAELTARIRLLNEPVVP